MLYTWPMNTSAATLDGNSLLHVMAGIGFPEGVDYILGVGHKLKTNFYNNHGQTAYEFACNGASGAWSGPTGDLIRARFKKCVCLLRDAHEIPDVSFKKTSMFRSWHSNEVLFAVLATGHWPLAKLFMEHHSITPGYTEGSGYNFLNAIQMCQAKHGSFPGMPDAYRWALGLGLSPDSPLHLLTPLDQLLLVHRGVTCSCFAADLMKESAIEFLLRGAKVHNGVTDSIPTWVYECRDQMDACRQAAFAMLCLQKKRGNVANNNRDAMRLVARAVWQSRFIDGCKGWEPCLKASRSKRACRGILPRSKK